MLYRWVRGDKKYWTLAALLWLGLLVHTLGGDWSSDFRFHTAAIAEFSNNPFDPRHIFVSDHLPHHSLSFYSQMWGWFARITGLSAITTTKVAGMVNATALVVVVPSFVRVFDRRRHAPFIALLLMTLAWGPAAWRLSSLLNLNSLGFGLPYPSYFAVWTSMALVAGLCHLMDRERLTAISAAMVAIAGFMISNAHLAVFGSFIVMGLALVVSNHSKTGTQSLGLVVGGATLGALLYPHPPLIGIVFDSGAVDIQNRTVYESILSRLWPTLPGFIPILQRLGRRLLDPLALTVVGLLPIYLAGFVFEAYVLGRVIVVLVICLQLASTSWILDGWSRLVAGRRRLTLALGTGVVALLAMFASQAIVRMVPPPLLPSAIAGDDRLATPVDWLTKADELLGPDDVVLAPPGLSQFFPSVGPKIVYLSPAAYIDDQEQRERDTERFFSQLDMSVIDTYNVTWVGFTQDLVSEEIEKELVVLGDVHIVDDVVLVRLR